MSAAQMPESQAPALHDRPYTFHMIPLLRELLPKQHGRPGLIYAQVHVGNERRAQDQGWTRIEGTVIYTIVGPKGHADMVLMGKGKPISGVGHASGKRRCVIDIAVERLTGHPVKSVPMNTAAAGATNGATNAVSEPKSQAIQDGKSDERVQSGKAAQR